LFCSFIRTFIFNWQLLRPTMRAAATQWQANEFHKENHTPLKKVLPNC
jgi:hypothetical protein